jgi:prepilin-type N-terminal cleavage/methylation domain-containing protein
MKRQRLIAQQNGFSLIETMIAAGLLSIFVTASTLIYMSIQKTTSTAQRNSVADIEVNNILDNIRTSVQNYQLNFDQSATNDNTLPVASLPMAWDVGTVTTAALCPNCKGRYGFYIQPMMGANGLSFPGLNTVHVRISNTDWPQKYQDYQFTVSVK